MKDVWGGEHAGRNCCNFREPVAELIVEKVATTCGSIAPNLLRNLRNESSYPPSHYDFCTDFRGEAVVAPGCGVMIPALHQTGCLHLLISQLLTVYALPSQPSNQSC